MGTFKTTGIIPQMFFLTVKKSLNKGITCEDG